MIDCNIPAKFHGLDIFWRGMASQIGDLLSAGWNGQVRQGVGVNAHYYVYLREPETRMLMRFKFKNQHEADEAVTKDCLLIPDLVTQEHNGKITPPKVLIERNITKADIPAMLDIIITLQGSIKKSGQWADVIDLTEKLEKFG